MTVQRSGLRQLGEPPREYASSSGVTRGFCARCGTSLTYFHESYGDKVDVTLGSLDDPGTVVPADHIWMSDAVSWDRPTDGLLQHERTR